MQRLSGFSKSSSLQLKGFASIMIVVHHFLHLTIDKPNLITYFISAHFGYIFVSLFFLLSAYGITETETVRATSFKVFLKKRVFKIYKPFVIVNLLTLMLYSVTGYQKYTFIQTFLCLFGVSLIDPFLWYIVMLILLYILFWVSFQVRSNSTKLVLLSTLCLVTMFASALIFKFPSNIYVSILSFPVGMACSLFKREINFFISGSRFYVLYALYTIAMILIFYLLHRLGFQLIKTIIMSMIPIPFYLKIASSNLLETKLLSFLGAISFEIYLVHMKVFVVMGLYLTQYKNLSIFLLIVIVSAYCLKYAFSIIDKLKFPILKHKYT
jgi:peptidoglycan/LPS O-acetylase OafA/YrhL